jgi:amino acid permease
LFGQKTIGGFGAVVLVANNVTGPGMLALPALFQKAGWLPTTVATIFIGAVSSAAACFFVDSIGLLPNNKTFNRRIEFCEPYRFHFGCRWELMMHVAFYLTLLCQNVASIVEVSQVMDSVLAWAFSETYALELMPRFRIVSWSINSCDGAETCVPFSNVTHEIDLDGTEINYGLMITLGYVLTFFVLMPIGLLPLDENIPFQIFSFVAMLVGIAVFLIQFCERGLVPGQVPTIGDAWPSAVGVILFNFSFSVTLPSLLNEMKPGAPIVKIIWGSVMSSALGYIVLGVFGGMAYSSVSTNFLSTLTSPSQPTSTRITAFLFAYFIIGFGVPVFCVIARYNLAASGRVSPRMSVFLGVALPWCTSWMLYQGSIAVYFENWAGIVVNGFVAFLAPIAVALAATGVTLSCDGVLRALFQPPRLPAPTAINPLPEFCLPYHTNLIAGAFIMVPPILLLAFIYQVGLTSARLGLLCHASGDRRRLENELPRNEPERAPSDRPARV